jgi:hypothetical protein
MGTFIPVSTSQSGSSSSILVGIHIPNRGQTWGWEKAKTDHEVGMKLIPDRVRIGYLHTQPLNQIEYLDGYFRWVYSYPIE